MERLDAIMADLRARAAEESGSASPPTNTAGAGKTRTRRANGGPTNGPSSNRKRLALIVVMALLALLVLPSILSERDHASAGSAPTAPPSHKVVQPASNADVDMFAIPTPLQWKPVIQQLDLRRGRLFIDPDVPLQRSLLLPDVDLADGPAYATDESLLFSMQQHQWHATAFPLHVLSVEEQYVTKGEARARAMLTVVDTMGAYDIADARGNVIRSVPARGRATWNVELINSRTSGWVFVSAEHVTTPASP